MVRPHASLLRYRAPAPEVLVTATSAWAQRRFAIAFRDYKSLQPAAQRMVEHLVRTGAG